MKKRVLARLEFMRSLVEKKLYEDYNLYTVLLPSEKKFYQVYVLALKDKMPDVCELYNKIHQHGKKEVIFCLPEYFGSIATFHIVVDEAWKNDKVAVSKWRNQQLWHLILEGWR